MRKHLELWSTLNSTFFYGIRMLNINLNSVWQTRFNSLDERLVPAFFLWLQNTLSSHFLSFHLHLLVFSLHLRLQVHKVLPSFAFQLHKATLLKIPEACLSYSTSPWEVNKCQRNVGLFMYLLGLWYISEKALWHLVITSLEDVTQGKSTVNISKVFRHFTQYNKSILFLRHYCVEKASPSSFPLPNDLLSSLFCAFFLRFNKQMFGARRNQASLALC